MMNPITTSVFDLFKVGPGPSSSHTIGPIKAANDFLHRLENLSGDKLKKSTHIDVTLYGSLSATGKGHGTDRAILAGLLDWKPETLDPVVFAELLTEVDDTYMIKVGEKSIPFNAANIEFGDIAHDFPFSNTLIMHLKAHQKVLYEMEYYSVGGGFIQWKGWKEPELPDPPYPYQSMDELKEVMEKHHLELDAVILENEKAISGLSEKEIKEKLDQIIDTMVDAVKRGITNDGLLPGAIKLSRKSPKVHHRAKERSTKNDHFLIYLNSYCLAASEENAAGNLVVTAPTSGASGVMPGVLYLLNKHYHKSREALQKGLLAAAAIGFLVKHNASISGAEMGCMGEVGTASAMAAAMICHVNDCDIRTLEVASEIAIEHHLGMTCDPVGGYVQIPCIERNAVGGVKAYNAYLLASSGISDNQKITLDKVINVMRETGRDMSKKYKETSQGGLALSMTEC